MAFEIPCGFVVTVAMTAYAAENLFVFKRCTFRNGLLFAVVVTSS